jgi:hypothetical protein
MKVPAPGYQLITTCSTPLDQDHPGPGPLAQLASRAGRWPDAQERSRTAMLFAVTMDADLPLSQHPSDIAAAR